MIKLWFRSNDFLSKFDDLNNNFQNLQILRFETVFTDVLKRDTLCKTH